MSLLELLYTKILKLHTFLIAAVAASLYHHSESLGVIAKAFFWCSRQPKVCGEKVDHNLVIGGYLFLK